MQPGPRCRSPPDAARFFVHVEVNDMSGTPPPPRAGRGDRRAHGRLHHRIAADAAQRRGSAAPSFGPTRYVLPGRGRRIQSCADGGHHAVCPADERSANGVYGAQPCKPQWGHSLSGTSMPPSAMPMNLILALLLVGGCATRAINIGDALVAGDQATVDEFSKRVLAGEPLITAIMLTDDREVSRAVILRVDRDGGTAQYGVDLVSDYFMCLLQAREGTSTRNIINVSAVDRRCKSEDLCEVCNSLTYPLPEEVRDALRRHWRAQLAAHR